MSQFHCTVIIVLIISIVFSTPFVNTLKAEEASLEILPPIVVSASHIPSSLEKTSLSITVINREEIEARQPISTVELLRQVSGLHIDQTGGRGGVSSLYIRGSDPNFTVVLIDGVKVNDPTNSRGGSFDFSTLDSADIEQIEIVRGSLSSVYGSDAMGGVVNIITGHGTASRVTSFELGGGAEDFYRFGFGTSGPLGNADYALNLSYVDDGSPVDGSSFVVKNIHTKITLSPSNTTWLQLVTRYSDSQSESFPDDSGGPAFSVLRDVDHRDTEDFMVGAEFGHDLRLDWEYRFKASFYNREEVTNSPGVAPGVRDPFGIPPNRSDNTFYRTSLHLSSLFAPFSSFRIDVGGEAQFEKAESEGSLVFSNGPIQTRFESSRSIYSAFLETEYLFPIGITISGGIRLDNPEHFDTEQSPHLGVLYRIDGTETRLKANWGEGFKLPSFFALGNGIVGNPNLAPETVRSFDVGVVQSFFSGKMRISGTFFHNLFFNLIDFFEGPPPKLVNRSEVSMEGVEMELSLKPTNQLWINSHLTFTETDIRGTSEALRNRPEWRGGANVRWQPNSEVMTGLSILYVGHRLDSSIATGDRRLSDYTRIDVAVNWALFKNWKISASIDNLFDTEYEEFIGFPATGIRPRLTLYMQL